MSPARGKTRRAAPPESLEDALETPELWAPEDADAAAPAEPEWLADLAPPPPPTAPGERSATRGALGDEAGTGAAALAQRIVSRLNPEQARAVQATDGPLLILAPVLAAARREGLRTYGVLVQRHNQAFHDKWIKGEGGDDSPLGNPDMSSLVDLGSSYLVIREMNIVPVSRRQMLQVAAVACLPGVPLLFLALPVMDVIRLLLGVVV